jgi:uncharacterized protein YggE
MKRLAILIPMLAACTPVTAQQPVPVPLVGPGPAPSIVTSAIGEARVTPDRALLEIGVQTRGSTASAAAAENARRQRAIIDTLKALGIPSELISTTNYSVYPEMRQDPRNEQQPVITGYNVNNTVRVEVRRIDQVGPIIDAVIARGANVLNSLSFFASNTDEPRRRALAEAVTRARQDAEALARAAGGSLGPLLELSDFSQGPRPMYTTGMLRAQVADAAPTPISPGEQQLQVTVIARWQFVGVR